MSQVLDIVSQSVETTQPTVEAVLEQSIQSELAAEMPQEQPHEHAEASEGVEEQDAPTHTTDEYRARLAAWGKLCASRSESFFHEAQLALDAILCYQGTMPGKAQRSTVLSELARISLESDDDCLYPPSGKDPAKFRQEGIRREHVRVCKLVQGAAVAGLLFGATTQAPIVGPDGVAHKPGKGKAIAWTRVRELFPLVHRPNVNDEYHERWTLLPHVEESARALVVDVIAGLKTADVTARVRKLCLESAQKRLEAGDKSAFADVQAWGGKIESAKSVRIVATPEETPDVDDESDDEADEESTVAKVGNPVTPDNVLPTNTRPASLEEQGKSGTVKDVAESMLALLQGKAEEGKADDTMAAFLESVITAGILSTRCQVAIMAAHKVIAK